MDTRTSHFPKKMRMKKKKGALPLETLAKLLIALFVLILLIMLTYYSKDKIYYVFGKLKGIMRFGR